MRLKTLPIQLEDRFLTEGDVRRIWQEIKLEEAERLVIAIDGPPGTGKSELAKLLQQEIRRSRVNVGMVETDLDCIPWSEHQAGTSLMDWHADTVTKEAIANPGADFLYTGYDLVTHERDNTVRIQSPKNGALIIEGLHSVEFARTFHTGPIVVVHFEISNELRERRRAERNIRQRRWKPEQVESKTEAQRSSAVTYFNELAGELERTSTLVHNRIRLFK